MNSDIKKCNEVCSCWDADKRNECESELFYCTYCGEVDDDKHWRTPYICTNNNDQYCAFCGANFLEVGGQCQHDLEFEIPLYCIYCGFVENDNHARHKLQRPFFQSTCLNDGSKIPTYCEICGGILYADLILIKPEEKKENKKK